MPLSKGKHKITITKFITPNWSNSSSKVHKSFITDKLTGKNSITFTSLQISKNLSFEKGLLSSINIALIQN